MICLKENVSTANQFNLDFVESSWVNHIQTNNSCNFVILFLQAFQYTEHLEFEIAIILSAKEPADVQDAEHLTRTKKGYTEGASCLSPPPPPSSPSPAPLS